MYHWLKILLGNCERPHPKEVDELRSSLTKQWIYPTTHSGPDDVYIAAFPKSGVTWLQHITAGLIYGLDPANVPDILVQTLIPDCHAMHFYLRTGLPTVFKTHDGPNRKMRRVVHLIRDGRDVAVSYCAMLRNQGHNQPLVELCTSAWQEHTLSWLENPFAADILRISYEQLHNEPLSTLSSYCNFLGLSVSRDVIADVVKQSQFELMQAKEDRQGWGPNDSVMKQRRFIRRGRIGSYKDEMPPEILNQFNEKNKVALVKCGYIDS